MKYRKLGRTDLQVSEIALGCASYWGNRNFPEKQAAELVHEAFEQGVNFFDTGHSYSNFNAEPRLGRILKGILAGNDRSRVIVSTKAGSIFGRTPIRASAQSKDFSPDTIEKSCADSIKNLNCGQLDLFQLHGFRQSDLTDALQHRLEKMKASGMFRYLGVNTHLGAEMEKVALRPDLFDMVLVDYNVMQLDREESIEKLARAGIGVVAGTVLAQGYLCRTFSGSVWNGSFFWYLVRTMLKPSSRNLAMNSLTMRRALRKVSEMSSSQAAFSYILDRPNIASCVLGTTSKQNLREILAAADMHLSPESKQAIRKAFDSIKETVSG